MTAALVYRALERNTGTVGGISAACTSIEPVNPEIAAISQHQDPASANAAATNKDIALALAIQIASVGGDPQTAIQSGTFAPGSVTDNTGKGNSCNDANDAEGYIFSQNLLVADVTAAEIDAAVGSASTGATPASAPISTAAASGVPVSSAVSASAPFVNSTDATTTAATGDLDFGSCNNPGIVFGPGFDGRKEDSFEPADTAQFTHGSALNIGVITGFIQDRLKDNCNASQQAIDAAQSAAAATKGLVGQAAADAWNNGLGLSSSSASNNSANKTSGKAATGTTNVDPTKSTGKASKSGRSGKAGKADNPHEPSKADKAKKAGKVNNAD